MADTPNLGERCFHPIDTERLLAPDRCTHAPRILLLYGSLRERSYSRLMTEEAARILSRFGAETKTFNPSGLPLPDDADASHPKVQELRDLVAWSEGMVWWFAEIQRRHALSMTAAMSAFARYRDHCREAAQRLAHICLLPRWSCKGARKGAYSYLEFTKSCFAEMHVLPIGFVGRESMFQWHYFEL